MSEVNIRIKDQKVSNGDVRIDGVLVTATFADEQHQPKSKMYEYAEFHDALGNIKLDKFFDRALMRFQEASGQVKPTTEGDA